MFQNRRHKDPRLVPRVAIDRRIATICKLEWRHGKWRDVDKINYWVPMLAGTQTRFSPSCDLNDSFEAVALVGAKIRIGETIQSPGDGNPDYLAYSVELTRDGQSVEAVEEFLSMAICEAILKLEGVYESFHKPLQTRPRPPQHPERRFRRNPLLRKNWLDAPEGDSTE